MGHPNEAISDFKVEIVLIFEGKRANQVGELEGLNSQVQLNQDYLQHYGDVRLLRQLDNANDIIIVSG